MPWLHSLVVQVTALTVKQPARFGFGGGADPCSATAPGPGNAEVWGLLLPRAGQTATLSPGAGRSGERGQPPAEGNLDAAPNSGC